MSEASRVLDELIETVAELEAEHGKTRNDAIDSELNRPPRQTSAGSLHNHPVIRQFRRELSDGMIRTDTLNRTLGLIRTVLAFAISA